jgi:hypothetical protein
VFLEDFFVTIFHRVDLFFPLGVGLSWGRGVFYYIFQCSVWLLPLFVLVFLFLSARLQIMHISSTSEFLYCGP